MEFKIYQASFVLNDFHRQATDVLDPTPPTPPTIWKTVSGNPIQILDAVASPMQKCEVTLEPIQSGSGDPSPANPRPITGWTGTAVNVSGADTSNPTTYSVTFPALGKNKLNIDELITADSGKMQSYTFKHKLTLTLKPNTDYTLSTTYSGSNKVLYFNDASSTSAVFAGSPKTATTKDDGILEIALYDRTGIELFEGKEVTVQLEEGTSATTYEPYTNTVYGGTYDFASGVLKVEKEYIEITGSNLYSLSTTSHESGTTVAYTYEMSAMRITQQGTLCDSLKTGSYGSGTLPANSIAFGRSNSRIYLCIDESLVGTTLDSFKTYLNAHPIHAVYILITPVEYNITPEEIATLAGENNVWGDGTIELTYLGLE